MIAAKASGFGGGRLGRPVVDMIEMRLLVIDGWLIATNCAIMPPIEAPATCARSIPSAARRPAASAAMSRGHKAQPGARPTGAWP